MYITHKLTPFGWMMDLYFILNCLVKSPVSETETMADCGWMSWAQPQVMFILMHIATDGTYFRSLNNGTVYTISFLSQSDPKCAIQATDQSYSDSSLLLPTLLIMQ